MSDPARDVVFISHATPQDNDFVKWLGARLIGLGYNVWADVFELKGGTPFWNTIEEAITTRAVKVIFVASTESVKQDRKGVRDEFAAADITGRRLKDTAFVIPVRLDKVDFGSFPIQLLLLGLTPGEARVAAFIGGGHSVGQAAEEFGIAESTVRSVIKAAYDKLDIGKQSELAKIVARLEGVSI